MLWGSSKLRLVGILVDRTTAIRAAEAEVAATQAAEAAATQAAAENLAAAVPGEAGEDLTSLRFYVDGLGFKMKRWWIPGQAEGQDDYKPDGRIRWCWLEMGEAAVRSLLICGQL